ncbi:MAG: hypothetical protein ACFB9N_07965 [Geitlerinemataceae cyanobacterium]
MAIEGGEGLLVLVGEVCGGEVWGWVEFAIEEVVEGLFVGAIELVELS